MSSPYNMALSAVLAVAVIVVAILIINQVKDKSEDDTESLIKSFEPGLLRISEEGFPDPVVQCSLNGNSFNYSIKFNDVVFMSSESKDLNFLVLANFQDALIVMGKLPDWTLEKNYILNSADDGKATLYMERNFVSNKLTGASQFLHLSLWSGTNCVKDRIISNNIVNIRSYTELLNKCPESYLSGASISGQIVKASTCYAALCKSYNDKNVCNSGVNPEDPQYYCYYDNGCKACPTEPQECDAFTNREMCSSCAWGMANGCGWALDTCINVQEQRAKGVRIKADPGDRPTETWEYRLTNSVSSLPNRCVVKAINEEGGFVLIGNNVILFADMEGEWIVKPGGILVNEGKPCSGLLQKCGAEQDYVSYNKRTYPSKASPDPDDSNEAIGGTVFTTQQNDKCERGKCYLLTVVNGKHVWKPKYEILCDSQGYWNICDEIREGKSLSTSEATYTCSSRKWTRV